MRGLDIIHSSNTQQPRFQQTLQYMREYCATQVIPSGLTSAMNGWTSPRVPHTRSTSASAGMSSGALSAGSRASGSRWRAPWPDVQPSAAKMRRRVPSRRSTRATWSARFSSCRALRLPLRLSGLSACAPSPHHTPAVSKSCVSTDFLRGLYRSYADMCQGVEQTCLQDTTAVPAHVEREVEEPASAMRGARRAGLAAVAVLGVVRGAHSAWTLLAQCLCRTSTVACGCLPSLSLSTYTTLLLRTSEGGFVPYVCFLSCVLSA